MTHSVHIIGRDEGADIKLPDQTVSRFHAELIVSADGMLFYSDRSSSGGSYVYAEGVWRAIRAYEVLPSDRIRLGSYETSVADLLAQLNLNQSPGGNGKISRDPVSGEVIRG